MSLFKKRGKKTERKYVYIVMHSTSAWRKGTHDSNVGYAIKPHVNNAFDSYEKAVAWIEKHEDYESYPAGWVTETHDLPGSTDEECFDRMWIEEHILN